MLIGSNERGQSRSSDPFAGDHATEGSYRTSGGWGADEVGAGFHRS